VAKEANARTFGQDLMRGEHVVGGRKITDAPRANRTAEWVVERGIEGNAGETAGSGTSIFDPVVCEIVYRWFCPPGGQVVDPFAGGSVRGVVAAYLGLKYWGVDLSRRQILANEEQAANIFAYGERTPPVWRCGDSRSISEMDAPEADLLFTCPPYGDLERYSDNPSDISTLDYPEFIAGLDAALTGALKKLRKDRFAAIVVGDFRDKNGHYRGFVADTQNIFIRAGLALYNEAILVTSVGSLPIRVSKQFEASRKLGKTHQNILVFIKGSAVKATKAIGPVEFGDIDGAQLTGVELL